MTHTPTLCSQCASPATETSGLCWPCSERRRLQAINADLLAALKAVEWVPLGNRRVCPNCGRRWDQGHAPTCKLDAALAKVKGE